MYNGVITDYLNNVILNSGNDKRLTRQFLFDESEENDHINTIEDVANDRSINIITGFYHRFPTKALIFPTENCLGHCRFCFRRNIRTNDVSLTDHEFKKIIEYLEENSQIDEVIFSGGDPFAIDPLRLLDMIRQVKQISSVKIIRIHTRVLTYNPSLVSDSFISEIKKLQPIFFVFHINSHLEMTHEAKHLVKRLVDNGIMCFSHTALLKDINDSTDDLKNLFTELIQCRIKPYYLFHPDRVKGTGHFYLPLEKGKKIYNSLFNYISGLAMPLYIFDIPNGFGHCIIDLGNVVKISNEKYTINTWQETEVPYEDFSCPLEHKCP